MSTEEKVKALILTKYKSLRDFVNNSDIGIPYTTVDGMLKRGLNNASISNVTRLCQILEISADELAKGNVVSMNESDPVQEYAQMLSKLSPKNLESAMMFINYLFDSQKEEQS